MLDLIVTLIIMVPLALMAIEPLVKK